MADSDRTRVISVGKDMDAPAAAEAGAEVLRAGGLVGFATETVYGIAAVATREETLARLRELKSRPRNPFSVHLGAPRATERYVRSLPRRARRLIRNTWPGPVTVIVPTGGELADEKLPAELHERLAPGGFIGLRCPDEPVALGLLQRVEDPVVAPSANLAGESSPRSAEDVLASLDGKLDLLLDSGPTRLGTDSTIVKFHGDGTLSVLREGAMDARTVRRLAGLKVLMVCTGNTCRSPIAAGLARKLLAEDLDSPVGELRRKGIEVTSAGIFAAEGQRATPEAVAAAKHLGASVARHRSRKVTVELIRQADLVLCMSGSHAEMVRKLSPEDAAKVHLLDKRGDIPDPVGRGLETYRKTAERIQRALRARMDEGLL